MDYKEKKKLDKKLNGIFSIYIRLRDAGENGYCKCCTCNKILHWTDMDNGHYINRGSCFALKFEPNNCHAQCRHCNKYREGNQHIHAEYIKKKHGQEMLDKLEYTKRFKGGLKYKLEYEELIKMYFYKAKEKAEKIDCIDLFIEKASQGHVLGKKYVKEFMEEK